MTDALLEVTHQSRDDAVARERLLLQQQQLFMRETNERQQRAVAEARAREKVLLEDAYKREQSLVRRLCRETRSLWQKKKSYFRTLTNENKRQKLAEDHTERQC